jgi:Glycosyltransferases involved in cell wall biogenesis
MIVKNEEKNLERCLKSIYELVKIGIAEIIIVDTGSTDNTVEMAKKYTDKVYLHKWKNDFSEARNYSISKANGEYIFILDADEELESEGLNKIINFYNREDYKKYGVLYFKEKNFMDYTLKSYGVFTRAFIFKNVNDFCYLGAIHEQPNIKGLRINLEIDILHYGYIKDKEIQEQKYIRNITLLKEEIRKNPNNLYIRYQSAISYLAHEEIKEAKREIDVVLNSIKDVKFDKLYLLYYDTAVRVYKENGLYEEALSLCNIGLSYQSDFIDILFYKVVLLFTMGKDNEVIKAIDEYIHIANEFKEHDIYHDSRFLFYHLDSKDEAINMGLVSCYITKNYNKFIEYVNQIDDENILKNKLYIIIEMYLDSDNYKGLKEFYDKRILNDGNMKVIFCYFIWKRLNEVKSEKISILNNQFKFEYLNKEYEKLQFNFIELYNFNNVDSITANYMVNDLVELISYHNISNEKDINRIILIKKAIKFVITRTLNSNQIKDISDEKIFQITEKYLELGLLFISDDKMLDEDEITFFKLFKKAIFKFQSGEVLQAVKNIKESVEKYNYAARMMEKYLNKYIPIYNDYIQMKKKAQDLVEKGDLNEAKMFLNEYKKHVPKDADNYSITAVINIMENNLEAAKELLQKGIIEHKDNFDLLYNLAYVYENMCEAEKAKEYYKKALNNVNSLDMKNVIEDKLKEIDKSK